MFSSGSGVSVPSACSSYAMKTRFQNSRNRRSADTPVRSRARRSRAPRPSRSRSRSRARTAPGRPPTRSSRRVGSGTIRSVRHADPLPELDRDLVGPELELRVAGVHRDPDAVPVELHVLQDELRRELDRAFLEVLAEREVPEHLVERQMVAVEPDLVDVGGAEALLRRRHQRRRRRLEAEEVRHQRLHPGAT